MGRSYYTQAMRCDLCHTRVEDPVTVVGYDALVYRYHPVCHILTEFTTAVTGLQPTKADPW